MKEYFLCSKAVIDYFPDVEKSKPFKSGYRFDKGDCYYVAVIDFPKVDSFYKANEERLLLEDFWCRECHAGSMEVDKITIAGCKRNGLFKEIENKIGLTTERNQAMTIYNLSQKYNCTPIEFINRIAHS